MLQLIYGPPGSGKTQKLLERLAQDLAAGLSGIVLVPEQQVVAMERLCAGYTEILGMASLNLEVLSFRRLANRLFREYGGLCYRYIDEGGQMLVLWQVLTALAPTLREYRQVQLADRGVISSMLSELKRLKRAALTPEMLLDAAERLEDGENDAPREKLCGKLRDLAALQAGYEALLKKEFDDPEEDLPRLCRCLDEGGGEFFRGKAVYLDGFSDLTGQEYAVLERILDFAPSVTSTVDKRRKDRRAFLSRVDIYAERLCHMAGKSRSNAEIRWEELPAESEFHRLRGRMEEGFFRDKTEEEPAEEPAAEAVAETATETATETKATGFRVYRCASPYEEALAAAGEILKDVQQGGRFSDHAVVVGDPALYAGILESVFDRCGIPCFFAVREGLTGRAAVRAILSALDILRGGWRTEDVIGYMKTGFGGISGEEAFALEEYARTWSVSGRRWYGEAGFTMHPDGYSDGFTEDAAERLRQLNESRQKLTLPLRAFFEVFEGGKATADRVTRELYRLLQTVGMEEQLKREAEAARQGGRKEDAETLSQLWNAICDGLDTLYLAAGELLCTPTLYSQMLQAVFSTLHLGSIPTGTEQVLFSGAGLPKGEKIRAAHLLGANEGIFPAAVQEGSVFSDGDLLLLEQVGISLLGDQISLSEEELHRFYMAAFLPSETLTVSYAEEDLAGNSLRPSRAVGELLRLAAEAGFFTEALEYRSLPPAEKIFDAESLLEQTLTDSAFLSEDEAQFRDFLRGFCLENAENPALRERYLRLLPGVTAGADCLGREFAGQFYGEKLSLTQSKIESFALCPLSYTLKYVLRLGEQPDAEGSARVVGNIMHLLLERFWRWAKEEKGEIPSEEEISGKIEEILNDYRQGVAGGEEAASPRMEQLLRRLRRSAALLLSAMRDEFLQSEFRPVCFELPLGLPDGGDGFHLPAPEIALTVPAAGSKAGDREETAVLRGIVDRVDAYRKDGKVYLRVVDYKTGNKQFSWDELREGLGLQPFLYLLALCGSRNREFDALTGRKEGESYRPAAALYFLAKQPSLSLLGQEPRETVLREAKKGIARSGVVLFDPEILQAMDKTEEGKFLPSGGKKEKGEEKGKNRLTEEEFSALLAEIPRYVSRIAEGIREGRADAAPLQNGKRDACLYCAMRPVCRRREISEAASEATEEKDAREQGGEKSEC